MKRDTWDNRFAFILASIGSAVGLGNAWRFPGLCAKFGGGSFLLAYILCMCIVGIPLLMMELAIGRKSKGAAPKAMRYINKKGEKVGWAAVTNACVILCYYVVVFAWCILMCFLSFKFATTHKTPETASKLWNETIGATWSTSLAGNGWQVSVLVLMCAFVAWALVYFCIRNGTSTVGKIAKYTVIIPVIMLLILAIKGFINNPYLGKALYDLFVPVLSKFLDPLLWINALGQSFYSLSIMMATMFAYGSYLKKSSNIAGDTIIIALSDLLISVLASVVLFTTLYSTGHQISDMSTSGIATAFIIYPTAIVQLSNVPWLNAVFGFVFYFMLCTLAIDSAFSMLEGVAAAVSDKFKTNRKKTTLIIAIVCMVISIFFTTKAGPAWLDIVDNWTNQYTLIVIGILETIIVGWVFRPKLILKEINKNSKRFKVRSWYFDATIKFVSPILLIAFFIWQIVSLINNGFRYDKSYGLYAEIIGGWLITALVFSSGFIIDFICKKTKWGKKILEDEKKEKTWLEELNQKKEKQQN